MHFHIYLLNQFRFHEMLKFWDHHAFPFVHHCHQFHLKKSIAFPQFLQTSCELQVTPLQIQLKSRLRVLIAVPMIFDGNDCGDLECISISGASRDFVRVLLRSPTFHSLFLIHGTIKDE
jgi:hypothetical protein